MSFDDGSHRNFHSYTKTNFFAKRFYLYKKQKKLRNVFIYKKPDTFQKARQFPLRFYTQKAIHWRYGIFMKFLKLAFIFKKHDTLRYVTFIYSKSMTLRKKQDNLLSFLYTQIRHFSVTRFFHWIFEICGGGGYLFLKRQCTLREIFILKK